MRQKIFTVTSGEGCGPGIVNLEATGTAGVQFRWYLQQRAEAFWQQQLQGIMRLLLLLQPVSLLPHLTVLVKLKSEKK